MNRARNDPKSLCNHFHLLLEVPPRPKLALTDEQLLKRLGALYSQAFVATVATELAEVRQVVAQGLARDGEAYVQRIHERLTYRILLLEEGQEETREVVNLEGERETQVVRKGDSVNALRFSKMILGVHG